MEVDKQKLKEKFKEGDYNYVFYEAETITNFLLIQKFKIYDEHRRKDITQECLENFYKKILKNKVDPNQNVFSFIWQNSYFRVLEILRKERNRNRIATFSRYDDLEGTNFTSYIDFDAEVGDRYVEAVQ